ncbi:rhodanese-like domain-containing protein [Undibacterium cyanobacteriorum]|uniref:Rhodanese-like domain-containing protein n=1 Tax=Undibacterium cyanobacteriorum TaxID=3073561 RepID=A0ABY9RP92_9BURK|nr:rhodanese-like domain-containing protein [Undibacterium sp. 20NA77.5]WMW82090.1 rhodanese-like domain-containing protein [Undibacterium sp. 20NA77.5]
MQFSSNSYQSRTGESDVPLLVDVRSELEYAGGHIQGALSWPLHELRQYAVASKIAKETKVLVYCLSGARSSAACRELASMGYLNVTNGGGISQLALQCGLPIMK